MSQPKSTSATRPTRIRAARGRDRTPAARKTRLESRFGPPLACYRSRRLAGRDFLLFVIPGIAACLAPLGYGLWRAQIAYAHYGPVAAAHWSRPWYNLSILATVIFLALGLYRLRLSLIAVDVYRKGISIRTGFGGARSFIWNDFHGLISSSIQEHFFGYPVRDSYRARLILATGHSIELPGSLQHLPELISRIKAKLYPRILPRLQAEFKSGAWLNFGPLAIQSQALRLEGKELPWHQVKHVDIRAGKLVIEFNDHSNRNISISRIPNLELVLQLIEQGIPN